CVCVLYFFFFHAEDGIRDFHVTGVQTCALPISRREPTATDAAAAARRVASPRGRRAAGGERRPRRAAPRGRGLPRRPDPRPRREIGRASCRARVKSSVGAV